MARVYLGWEVVWSLPLVLMVVGGQVATLGWVARIAATPPATASALFFSNGNPTGVASFSPAPSAGSRILQMDNPYCPALAAAEYGPPNPHCPGASVTITGCSTSTCQGLDGFRTTVSWRYGWTQVVLSDRATTFLFTLSPLIGSYGNVPLALVMTWLGGYGVPQGYLGPGELFAGTMFAGLGLVLAAWTFARHAGSRHVREVAFADRF